MITYDSKYSITFCVCSNIRIYISFIYINKMFKNTRI
nr:MAG TPA: hypothetical protein [Bacteriophage sp.]